jgi:hypothetical protein
MTQHVEIVPKGDLYTGSGHAPFPANQMARVSAALAVELKRLGETVEPEIEAAAPAVETEPEAPAPETDAAAPATDVKIAQPPPTAAPPVIQSTPLQHGPEIRGVTPAA